MNSYNNGDNAGGYDPIFQTTVRAGKRKYFFDVKNGSRGRYLIVTESKRNPDGFIEKHKIMFFPEDAEDLQEAFLEAMKELVVGREESGLQYAPGGDGYQKRHEEKEANHEMKAEEESDLDEEPVIIVQQTGQDDTVSDTDDLTEFKIEL